VGDVTFRSVSQVSHAQEGVKEVMGNRDTRGRQKKKPKKKEAKETGRSARAVPEYKRPTPMQQEPNTTSSMPRGES